MRAQNLLQAAGTLVVLYCSINSASAQNCYYPNGDVARTDASCSSDGGACCPLGWDCLSNGLCFLGGNEQYFGRYTCTDRNWGGDCPQYCTSNNTAAGNEAIVQCSDGSWCCDKNRDPQKPDCCEWDDKEVIDVPDGTTVTSITSTPRAPSSVPPFTPSPASPTTSSRATTSSSRPSITTDAPATITTRATSSDSTGGIVVITSIVTSNSPSPTAVDPNLPSVYPGSYGPPSNGVAIGASVGVGAGMLILLIALFFFWRRRKQKWAAQRSPPTSDYPTNHMSFMYNHGKHAHEIDSYPVAVAGGRGKDKSRPISELTGSNHFMPGSPVSSMHTAVSPPGYSPSGNGSVSAGMTGTWANSPTCLPGVQEQPEPQELPPEGNPPRESQQAPMPATVPQVQPKTSEMTHSGGGGGLFKYEPYRPYRPAELVKTGNEPTAQSSGAEALRTMSPDPPQPIQGGLRVVNQ